MLACVLLLWYPVFRYTRSPYHCRGVTSLMRWCPYTLVTPQVEDTQWEKQGLRSSRGHWRPRQRPRLDEPVSSAALETRHFWVHIRSAWAWPCAARSKAHASQDIICRSVPGNSEPAETQLSGRLPGRWYQLHIWFNWGVSQFWKTPQLRVDLNPRISKICASWMSVWNISANYVLVPLKFNLNWNIWNPFLKTPPLDFSGQSLCQRLGNTSLVVFLRFHSFSQVVKWPEFVRLYTTNMLNV